MTQKNIARLITVGAVVLVFIVAAINGMTQQSTAGKVTSALAPTNTPVPTDTPAPTDTPQPTPKPTLVPTVVPTIDENATILGGGYDTFTHKFADNVPASRDYGDNIFGFDSPLGSTEISFVGDKYGGRGGRADLIQLTPERVFVNGIAQDGPPWDITKADSWCNTFRPPDAQLIKRIDNDIIGYEYVYYSRKLANTLSANSFLDKHGNQESPGTFFVGFDYSYTSQSLIQKCALSTDGMTV